MGRRWGGRCGALAALLAHIQSSNVVMWGLSSGRLTRPLPLFHLVKYYNPVSNLCIVRCSRDEHQQVQFLGPTCSTTTSVFIAALNESHQLMPLYHLY